MERLKKSIRVRNMYGLQTKSEQDLTNAQLMLENHDLRPVEPQRRQWGPWNFVSFWIADSFNINTWMIASSMITGHGIACWQAILCIWIGYSIAAIFVCAAGRIGAVYHVSFPVVARSSFGIWGAQWPVVNRMLMACFWYGVQSWIGGQCMTLMVRSIWPSYYNLGYMMPSIGINARDFGGFSMFWLISLPAIWFPVHKIRHLFTVKAYVVPCAGIAFFMWAVVRANGIGPIIRQPAEASGSALAWGMVAGIMSSIANFATLIVNNPDFSRFARKPRDAMWSQLFAIPVGFAVTSFIGLTVSSSSKVIFNDAIWNPLDLLSSFLLHNASRAERFGVFVIAAAFVLAQLGTNIAANSVSAGTDMTALLPRYINIRRGGYICATIGLCVSPWRFLESHNSFTTYLSSYSVFMSSVAGVVLCDYYMVRRGHLELGNLYSAKPESPYFYTRGWHWRAYAAYIAGIFVNLAGFADAVGMKGIPIAAVYVYRVNFFAGLIVSGSIYHLLCRVFPTPASTDGCYQVGVVYDRPFGVVFIEGEAYDAEHFTGHDIDEELEAQVLESPSETTAILGCKDAVQYGGVHFTQK